MKFNKLAEILGVDHTPLHKDTLRKAEMWPQKATLILAVVGSAIAIIWTGNVSNLIHVAAARLALLIAVAALCIVQAISKATTLILQALQPPTPPPGTDDDPA